jgi:hypothetical protein
MAVPLLHRQAELSHRYRGHALCVRGLPGECQVDPDDQILCIRTMQRIAPSDEAERANVPVEAWRGDGPTVELGISNEHGYLCVSRSVIGEDPLLLACDGPTCAALAPGRELGTETLVLDPPRYGDRVRRGRLCLSLRTPYGQPICGAPLKGLRADGDFVTLGRTGLGGRDCVKHRRLESVALLLVCPWGCQAIAPELFESSGEIVLTLDHYDPPCQQSPQSTCPCSKSSH